MNNNILYNIIIIISSCCPSRGGAIVALNPTLMLLNNCSFLSCESTSGSAILLLRSSPNAVIIANSTFDSNICSGSGTIQLEQVSTAIVQTSTFIRNRAQAGSAITITPGSSTQIFHSNILNNSADLSGAISVGDYSVLLDSYSSTSTHISPSLITSLNSLSQLATTSSSSLDNVPGSDGIHAALYLHSTNITNNYAQFGAGIYVGPSDATNFVDSIVNGNNATIGGGLYFFHSSLIQADNTLINSNRAVKGGGIAIVGPFTECPFIHDQNNSTIPVCWQTSHFQVSSNIASNGGGGRKQPATINHSCTNYSILFSLLLFCVPGGLFLNDVGNSNCTSSILSILSTFTSSNDNIASYGSNYCSGQLSWSLAFVRNPPKQLINKQTFDFQLRILDGNSFC